LDVPNVTQIDPNNFQIKVFETQLSFNLVCFVRDLGLCQVLGAAEGGDEGVRMGPLHRNVEQFAGKQIARSVKTN
jgi:hypothetical protein